MRETKTRRKGAITREMSHALAGTGRLRDPLYGAEGNCGIFCAGANAQYITERVGAAMAEPTIGFHRKLLDCAGVAVTKEARVAEDPTGALPRAGQVAVVTGGSAGLGLAIADALARAGSTVVLVGSP